MNITDIDDKVHWLHVSKRGTRADHPADHPPSTAPVPHCEPEEPAPSIDQATRGSRCRVMERVPVKQSHKRPVSNRSRFTQGWVCFRLGGPASLDQGFEMACEGYRAGREV